MSKFIFVCEKEAIPFDDCISSKKTVEFSTYNLYDIISEFQIFLRGCGYCFDGQLEIVDDEEMAYQTVEPVKQKYDLFDFDEIPQNNWPFFQSKPESSCISEKIKPLTTADLQSLSSFNFEMPGTLGGAKVTFASEK